MRARVLGSSILVVISLAVSSIFAQQPCSASDPGCPPAGAPAANPIPYTAEFKTASILAAADGSTSTEESSEVRAVDSEGRVMTKKPLQLRTPDGEVRWTIQVEDPQAHTITNWTMPGVKAFVMSEPLGNLPPACLARSTGPLVTSPTNHGKPLPQSRVVTEDLGNAELLGIEIHGIRKTTPAGISPITGAANPVHIIEVWTATDPGFAGLVVRRISDGTTMREMVSFDQNEPDPSEFQPPQNFQIVDKQVPQPACAAQ
jgi:hypothetical protein